MAVFYLPFMIFPESQYWLSDCFTIWYFELRGGIMNNPATWPFAIHCALWMKYIMLLKGGGGLLNIFQSQFMHLTNLIKHTLCYHLTDLSKHTVCYYLTDLSKHTVCCYLTDLSKHTVRYHLTDLSKHTVCCYLTDLSKNTVCYYLTDLSNHALCYLCVSSLIKS